MSGILGIRRTVSLLVILACLGLACSGSTDDELLEAPTATTEATTTSETVEQTTTTEATTSTLSPAQQEESDARAEIKQVIVNWWEFPYDSTKGEAGIPVQYTTGLLQQRIIGNLEQNTRDGQIVRSRGGSRTVVNEIGFDPGSDTAEAEVCSYPDRELLDAETGEVLNADTSPPTESTVVVTKTPEGWRVSELFSTEAAGEPEFCDIPGVPSN